MTTFLRSEAMRNLILAYCPSVLVQLYQDRIFDRIPATHLRALVAHFIGARMVYSEGLRWVRTVTEVKDVQDVVPGIHRPGKARGFHVFSSGFQPSGRQGGIGPYPAVCGTQTSDHGKTRLGMIGCSPDCLKKPCRPFPGGCLLRKEAAGANRREGDMADIMGAFSNSDERLSKPWPPRLPKIGMRPGWMD